MTRSWWLLLPFFCAKQQFQNGHLWGGATSLHYIPLHFAYSQKWKECKVLVILKLLLPYTFISGYFKGRNYYNLTFSSQFPSTFQKVYHFILRLDALFKESKIKRVELSTKMVLWSSFFERAYSNILETWLFLIYYYNSSKVLDVPTALDRFEKVFD